jgi:hypothetical protein
MLEYAYSGGGGGGGGGAVATGYAGGYAADDSDCSVDYGSPVAAGGCGGQESLLAMLKARWASSTVVLRACDRCAARRAPGALTPPPGDGIANSPKTPRLISSLISPIAGATPLATPLGRNR